MKRQSHLLVAVVLAMGLTGCGGKGAVPEQSDGPSHGSVGLDEDFTLHPGESIRLGAQSRLRFVAVLEDSRCPPDVQCIWAGNAELSLKLDDSTLSINSTVEPREAVVRGYRFQLVSLTQRAHGDSVATPYSATFRVTRE